MIWGPFTRFEKCRLIIMPLNQRFLNAFVEIVYEGTLIAFHYLHDCPRDLFLMEDGAPVYYNLLCEVEKWVWHEKDKKVDKLPLFEFNQKPMKSFKILKDHVQWESKPRTKDEMIKGIHRAWERISTKLLDVLIATMLHKMHDVIVDNGGRTKW